MRLPKNDPLEKLQSPLGKIPWKNPFSLWKNPWEKFPSGKNPLEKSLGKLPPGKTTISPWKNPSEKPNFLLEISFG